MTFHLFFDNFSNYHTQVFHMEETGVGTLELEVEEEEEEVVFLTMTIMTLYRCIKLYKLLSMMDRYFISTIQSRFERKFHYRSITMNKKNSEQNHEIFLISATIRKLLDKFDIFFVRFILFISMAMLRMHPITQRDRKPIGIFPFEIIKFFQLRFSLRSFFYIHCARFVVTYRYLPYKYTKIIFDLIKLI